MQTHADKTQENKSQSVSNGESQVQSGGKSTFQFVDNRPEAVAQRKLQETVNNGPRVNRAFQLEGLAGNHSVQQQQPVQKKENNTGLPDNLKTGIENLSGYSMDDVKVHRNSDKPAELQAYAYAQGTDIHLGPGQEKHLPHEAWHVVQQKQGRVKPTMQMKGKVNVNDDGVLEKEADILGKRALQFATQDSEKLAQHKLNTQKANATNQLFTDSNSKSVTPIVQRAISRGKNTGWGWMSWVNNDAEALWNTLVTLYNDHLPAMSIRLAQKAIAYPLHKDPFDLKVEQINGVIGGDVEVAYNVAETTQTNWEQLITDGNQLITNLQATIDADQKKIDALNVIKKNANDIMQKMQAIKGHKHKEGLFPDLDGDKGAYQGFTKKVNDLKAGKFDNATLTAIEQQGTTLTHLLEPRHLTHSLIEESKVDSRDDNQKKVKNLIDLRGRSGVTDIQLHELFNFFKADELRKILDFANPTKLLTYLKKDGIDKGHLFLLYSAMNRPGKDTDIKFMLDNIGVVNIDRVKLLATAIENTNGDAANNLPAMIQGRATIEFLVEMQQRGGAAIVEHLLVTRKLNPDTIGNCLDSNSGKHTFPLLAIEPDPDFLLLYDKCGFSRDKMLGQMQVLNIVPANQNAFVAGVKDGRINDISTAEVHLGTTDRTGDEHWPVKSVESCTSGQERIHVNQALNNIVNGLGPPIFVKMGQSPKWNETYNNEGRNGDGRLPGVLGQGGYVAYYVQKSATNPDPNGSRRIVVGSGKYYYTNDHYEKFTRIR